MIQFIQILPSIGQPAGFKALHKRLEKKIIVIGKSQSTLANYMHCVAHVAFHFNRLPTQLDLEQIEDYLLHLKKKGAFQADFKLTVYGLRFLFRCEGLDDRAIPALINARIRLQQFITGMSHPSLG